MGAEVITIELGDGKQVVGWKSSTVTCNARSPERSFQLVGAPGPGINPAFLQQAQSIKPGAKCQVRANGDLMVTGYVNDVEIELDEGKHEVRVTGKSKGQDLSACVDHESFEFRNKKPVEILQEVDGEWGIGFTTDEDVPPIDVFRCNVGTTGHKLLDQLTAPAGMFATGQPDGSVKLTTHGKLWHAGGIIEGSNFLRGVARFSDGNRMSKVKVKGQRAVGTGAPSTAIEEIEEDPGARPGRTLIIIPKVAVNRDQARKLAENTINYRFGRNTSLQCEVQGFRDNETLLWTVGYLIWCDVPSTGLQQELAIDEVVFEQSAETSIAHLRLVHPSALGQKSNQKKSGRWNKKTGNFEWNNNGKP